jgi:hypothetical protein
LDIPLEGGLFGGRNHSAEAIAAGSVDVVPHIVLGLATTQLRRRRRIDGWLRCLGGADDAANFIVFSSNDDRLVAVSVLQTQDAAVLNAAPPDCHDGQEDAKPEDDRYET